MTNQENETPMRPLQTRRGRQVGLAEANRMAKASRQLKPEFSATTLQAMERDAVKAEREIGGAISGAQLQAKAIIEGAEAERDKIIAEAQDQARRVRKSANDQAQEVIAQASGMVQNAAHTQPSNARAEVQPTPPDAESNIGVQAPTTEQDPPSGGDQDENGSPSEVSGEE